MKNEQEDMIIITNDPNWSVEIKDGVEKLIIKFFKSFDKDTGYIRRLGELYNPSSRYYSKKTGFKSEEERLQERKKAQITYFKECYKVTKPYRAEYSELLSDLKQLIRYNSNKYSVLTVDCIENGEKVKKQFNVYLAYILFERIDDIYKNYLKASNLPIVSSSVEDNKYLHNLGSYSSRDLFKDLVLSECSLDEYCDSHVGIEQTVLAKAIYLECHEKAPEVRRMLQQKQKPEFISKIIDISKRMEDNEYTVLDYFIETGLSPRRFIEIIKTIDPNSRIKVQARRIGIINNQYSNIDYRYRYEITEREMQQLMQAPGFGYSSLTELQVLDIMNFLSENNIPNEDKLYKTCAKLYLEGKLDINLEKDKIRKIAARTNTSYEETPKKNIR